MVYNRSLHVRIIAFYYTRKYASLMLFYWCDMYIDIHLLWELGWRIAYFDCNIPWWPILLMTICSLILIVREIYFSSENFYVFKFASQIPSIIIGGIHPVYSRLLYKWIWSFVHQYIPRSVNICFIW